jgi:pimeloyl-ACP methyl ester carboxylesterase
MNTSQMANRLLALLAMIAIGAALWNLHAQTAGVSITTVSIDGTPATLYRPASGGPAPVVVIAHGFAGSQQLMQSFGLTFARNGYIAVTFDFLGHGRNPTPLTGSITETTGATRALVDQLAQVAAFARGLGDGGLAVLGHSMASDIAVRFAESAPEVATTVAISMFSPAVTASAPRNLLVIVGAWEGPLKREALRAVGLATAPAIPRVGVTYGDFALGTGRRAVISPHVDHVSVLFSQTTLREAVNWLDQSFGIKRATPAVVDSRGPWILVLFGAIVLLARPLSTLLPRVADARLGAGLKWRRLWVLILIPMVATPLLLRVLPTHFLPVLVGDYLACHFALYGLITALCLWVERSAHTPLQFSRPALAAAAAAVIAFGFVGVVWPINSFFTSFVPGPGRFVLILVMLVGTLLFFISDEWLTRGEGAARGAYAVSKIAFLLSLALAVALDPMRLFFLIIIVPVIVIFFVVYGLFSRWTYRQTQHPLVAGIANAVAFAWAIGVTFPLLAG